eukprot:277138-Amphidinium_carterae.1
MALVLGPSYGLKNREDFNKKVKVTSTMCNLEATQLRLIGISNDYWRSGAKKTLSIESHLHQ